MNFSGFLDITTQKCSRAGWGTGPGWLSVTRPTHKTLLLANPGTRSLGTGDVDGGVAFDDLGDLSVGVDHESSTAGHATIRHEDTVRFGDRAVVIAEQRESDVFFFCPVVQSCNEVSADHQNLRVERFKVANTGPVGSEFLGSTTGERGWEER
jgi:hypothetical protein